MWKVLCLSLLLGVAISAQVSVDGMDNLRDLETQAGYDANRLQKARDLVRDIERELRFRRKKGLITVAQMAETQAEVRLILARVTVRENDLGAEELEILQVVQDLLLDTHYEIEVLNVFVQYHQRKGDRDAQLNALEDLILHPEFGRHPDCAVKARQFEAIASKAYLMEQDQPDWAIPTWEQYFQALIDAECFAQLRDKQVQNRWRQYQQLLKKANQKVPEHLRQHLEQQGERQDKHSDSAERQQYQQETLAILKENLGLN